MENPLANFNKEKYVPPMIILWAALAASAIFALAYFGWQYWDNYQVKREQAEELRQREADEKVKEAELASAQVRLESELRDQLRDQEIEILRKEIMELKNKPASKAAVYPTPAGAEDSIADIVKEWSPKVAHVECQWLDKNGTLYARSSGAATIVNFINLGFRAITNRHVLLNNKFAPTDCKVTLLNGVFYDIDITSNNVSIGNNEDWAYITLPSTSTLAEITKTDIKLCQNVETGDNLLVLGYPRIGSKTGLTVTEGIVSGFDDNYYITSAKIDKGNSGGAAILVKDNCYLGIPSASVVGTIESLGRILKASFVIAR